jgi:nucleoside-diphosphate-sugar epimerase
MILVTGGTGFVGRHVVSALCSAGHSVRVLTRHADHARTVLGDGVELAAGDVLDATTLDSAGEDVEIVVHLAASVPRPGPSPPAVHDTNVQGTGNLAAVALRSGVRLFIHGSSAGVYGDGLAAVPHREDSPLRARSEYERSKVEAERAVRSELEHTRVGLVVLRIAGVHGPGRPATLAFYREVLRRRIWLHAPATVIVHPTYVGDVVQAILSAADRNEAVGSTLNIAGERAVTYPELIDLTGRLLGTRVRQIRAPAVAGRVLAGATTASYRLLGRPVPDSIARLGTSVINRSLDTSLARSVLGFTPAPLEDTIRDTITWYRQQGML